MKLSKEHIPYNLLAAHLANELSFSQKEALNAWVNENPSNRTILLELKTIWNYKNYKPDNTLKSC